MSKSFSAVIVTAANHTHAGTPVAKGSRLHVDEATAKWLIANKIAVPAKPTDAAHDTESQKESKA